MKLFSVIIVAFVGSTFAMPQVEARDQMSGFIQKRCIAQGYDCGSTAEECCAGLTCTAGGCY
ncbi:hypothetical protein N7528_000996 [Penicillium herquei]|nr:hypothetical protein N7528_000996 [Penicillium herquei]